MLSLSEAENVFDILPVFAIIVLMPLLVVVSPALAINQLNQLNVYRVQHFDLQNTRFGCRQSVMNLESVSVSQIKESFAKKCVIFRINDLVEKMDTFQTLIDETLTAGILIIIPKNIRSLSGQQLEQLLTFERYLVNKEIQIPIYITFESRQLLNIYEMQSKSPQIGSEDDSNKSNIRKIYDSVVANGYQMVVSGPPTSPLKELIITNIQGKLIGAGVEDQMPTIALIAHYDAFSIAPSLSFGADSNGSGIVALLELIRIFSKLYSNPKTQPKVNLLFVMSGAGKFNYMGTKKWIDNQMDNDNNLLSDSLFTICLDSLADSESNNGLYMHVSKPPKEGSPASKLFNDLKQISLKSSSESFNVSMVHKKINLAEESLAWEHERFSIRRLSAFTLSSLSSHKSLRRKSLTDIFDEKLVDPLYSNINLISESISRQLYKDFDFNLFDSDLKVSKSYVKSLLFQISRQSRAQQLISSTQKGSQIECSPFVKSLEQIMRRYVTDIELIHLKVDPKANELVFYDPTETILNIYNVKPAIFDLFVSLGIALYLLIFFVILTNFHFISSFTKKFINSSNDYNSKF